jgi:hypothetical protein
MQCERGDGGRERERGGSSDRGCERGGGDRGLERSGGGSSDRRAACNLEMDLQASSSLVSRSVHTYVTPNSL